MDFEITGTEGISVGTMGSIEDFLGNLEMPADKYKSTPKDVDVNKVIDTIKGEDGENTIVVDEGQTAGQNGGRTENEGVVIKDVTSTEGGNNGQEPTKKEGSNQPTEGGNNTEGGSTQESSESVLYKSLISDLVKNGLWEGFEGIEDEKGNVIPLDEVNIDKDLFYSIIEQKTEEAKNKAAENKISVEGVSDFVKRVIELDKKGGNVRSAMETYNNYQNPIDSLDLEKVEDQRKMVYLRYATENKLDEQEIQDIIEIREKNGRLKETAIAAKEQLQKAIDMKMEALEQEAVARAEQEKANIKAYRGKLNESFDKQFQLKDSVKNKLIELATKRSKEGAFQIDLMFDEAMRDVDKAAKIIMLIANEEEYNKQISERRVREDKINTMKSIRLVPKSKSSNLTIPTNKGSREDYEEKTFDPSFLFDK